MIFLKSTQVNNNQLLSKCALTRDMTTIKWSSKELSLGAIYATFSAEQNEPKTI